MKPTSVVDGVALGALGALVAVLLYRSLPWPLVHDAPIMHYVAWRISEGAVPYRDLFDMNMPGVYLIHLAVLATGGAGDLAWRVLDLVWLAASAGAVAALAAPWGALAAAGGGLFFAAYHLAGGAWQAGQRDFLIAPLLLVGALGVARWLERPGRTRRGALGWAGAALGGALTIKPHALVLAALLGGAALVAARRAGAGVMRSAAVFGLGLMAPPAAVMAWLAAVGGLGAFREIVVDYLLPLYARLGRAAEWRVDRWPVWIPLALAVAGSLASAAWRRRLDARHLVAALGLAYGVAHYVGQGKGWEYHLHPLAAFVAVVLFSELGRLVAERRIAAAAPLGATLVVALVLLGAKGVEASDARWIWDKERTVRLLAGELGERRRPGDLVQVLDTTEGGIHALLRLGVVQPTRFLYDFHFYHDADAPAIQRLRAEFIRQLDARPPRFIVLFERAWPSGGYERVARFPALAERLERRYALLSARPGYRLYAQRDCS